MHTQSPTPNRVRRTINDLVMAELFLVEATLESAAIISDGFAKLGKQIGHDDEAGADARESIVHELQRIADNALEPYSSRFRYLRGRSNSDS